MTRFLVEGPSSAGISRETLIEAVRSLLRERDYLRRARDLQLADFLLEASALRQHADELEGLLQLEAQASQEQSEALKRELAALREELERLIHERGEILADREAMLADRDAWRARATLSFAGRVRRKLRRLGGRMFGSGGETERSTHQAHSGEER